ncbi:MAG: type IV pilus secretin PilQ [Elusimicrobia bacterium]|nr:type IV pilus secretin PilQ [Elusimicrobiota bacterium]
MRTFLTKSAATLLTLCLSWPPGLVYAAPAPDQGKQAELDTLLAASKPKAIIFDGIEVSEERVTMKLSGKAKHQTQLLTDPPRLLIDLYGTDYQVGVKTVPGKGKLIKSVRGAQYKGPPDMVSRIVVDLSEAVPYRVAMEENSLVLALLPAGEGAEAVAPAGKKPEPAKAAAAPAAEKKPEPAKAAVAAVKPVEASAPVAASAPPETVAARPKVVVPKPQPQPQQAVVVAQMPALASNPASAVAAPRPSAASSPNERVLKLEGKCGVAGSPDLMSRMPCELVDLDFDNTNIKDILALLSAKSGINIISGPDVTGNLTLHLTGVPFPEAFRTILSMMGLNSVQLGDNILRVLTQKALGDAQKNATNTTRVLTLRYAKAADLLTAVNALRNAEGRSSGSALLDEGTNSLILTDSVEGLAATERIISRLDIVPKQVLIEAKLVEVKLNNDLDFGIKWNYYKTQTGRFLGDEGITSVGSQLGEKTGFTAKSIYEGWKDLTGLAQLPSSNAGSPQTGVNLLPSGAVGMLTIGRVTNNYFLNFQLGALAQQRRLKVLSDPKIATLNNKPAEINVTDQVPYDTSVMSSVGTISRSVTYTTMGIILKVTPSISADETRITLDINPEVSKPSGTAGSVSGAPSVSRSTAKTIVIVKDGETVVIGGLITDSNETKINKVPILGDIPILGWLFKKKFISKERKELLIFVTPRIMKDA